jgi:hypothetical protein
MFDEAVVDSTNDTFVFDYSSFALSDNDATFDAEPERNTDFVSSARYPDWLPKALTELQATLKLKRNWDSYNSKEISPEVVAAAVQLLVNLIGPRTPRPAVIPTSSGHIQLEWCSRNLELEVEIESATTLHVLFVDENEDEWETKLSYDLSELNNLIRRLSL